MKSSNIVTMNLESSTFFLFLNIRWLDLVDIVLVALLLFQLYKLIKGTAAIRIFLGILAIYLLWKLVSAMQMELLSEILGQFIGVGVLALIIVFQQEIRRFLLLVGSQSPFGGRKLVRKFLKWSKQTAAEEQLNMKIILSACENMGRSKTGALMVISLNKELGHYASSGVKIDAKLSRILIETIFFKNSPLHDGGLIIYQNRIKAAGCILPLSDSQDIPSKYGLRHRAALGLSENSTAMAIVVSEETGHISIAKSGKFYPNFSIEELGKFLENELLETKE